MTSEAMMKRFLAGEILEAGVEAAALAQLAKSPGASAPLMTLLANQRRRLHQQLATAVARAAEAEARLASLMQPPLLPARVLRRMSGGRLDVAAPGRRAIVGVVAELAEETFAAGDEVLLDAQGALVVARGETPARTGVVGIATECEDGRVVVRGPADEAILAAAAPELADRIAAGDRVVYLPEVAFVVDRLPAREASRFDLEQVPDVTFDDVGGLDEVVAQLRRDLDMRLVHPEIAKEHRLEPLKGVTFVGPPGVGKTLVAKAVANHLARHGRAARFLDVKPGALRGSLYGQTEARIRELFAAARSRPDCFTVIFFDELDTFGSRGEGAGLEIDSRVLPAFLAEIDGLATTGNVLCIGATNRLDLCDEALVRPGRFLDRRYDFPRPGRAAVRAILERRLHPDVPYAECGRELILDAATSHLFAAPSGAGLATLTFANGEQRALQAADVLAGALLTSAVERAKYAAAARAIEGDETGLRIEDVLGALDEAVDAEVEKTRSPNVARRLLTVPRAEDILRVEIARRPLERHRLMRAA